MVQDRQPQGLRVPSRQECIHRVSLTRSIRFSNNHLSCPVNGLIIGSYTALFTAPLTLEIL